MKSDIKPSFSLLLNVIVVSIMCAILLASLSVLNSALFKSGYKAYVTDEKGETVEKYDYYFDDGEDKKAEEYAEKEGYAVTKVSIVSKTGIIVDYIAFTVLSLSILIMFVYNKVYTIGNRDFNSVKCGHKNEDKWRGLRIGILAMLPDILLFIFMVILKFAKPDTPVGFYKLANIIFYKLLDSAMGQNVLADMPVWGFAVMLLPLCAVPVISHISYMLGYKDIKLSDKFTYKKGEIK